MNDMRYRFFVLGRLLGWTVVLLVFFIVAALTGPPLSIIVVCVTPIPLLAIGFDAVGYARHARARIRASRSAFGTEEDKEA